MNQTLLAAHHGTRKSAVANAYLYTGTGKINVRLSYDKKTLLNLKRRGKNLSALKKDVAATEYFRAVLAHDVAAFLKEPLVRSGQDAKVNVTLVVKGGGVKAQLEAAQLAIAKSLVKIDEAIKPTLGSLCTTDARKKERAKIGHRGKARRKVQFSKR